MYADGGAEEVTGEAIAGRRDEVFLVSKVLPNHASRTGDDRRLRAQPQAARHRHASTSICCTGGAAMPLADTITGFETLLTRRQDPLTGASPTSMSRTWRSCSKAQAARLSPPTRCSTTSPAAASNMTSCPGRHEHTVPLMAYSPIEQGRLAAQPRTRSVSPTATDATAAQIALAFVAAQAGCDRHPQGRQRGSRPRQRGRGRYRARRPTTCATSTCAFPPPRPARAARDDLRPRRIHLRTPMFRVNKAGTNAANSARHRCGDGERVGGRALLLSRAATGNAWSSAARSSPCRWSGG